MVGDIIEFVDFVHDYLVGIENGRLHTFLTQWPSQPYTTRSIIPSTLPVLSQLANLPVDASNQTSQVIQRLKNIAPNLYWGQTYSAADFGSAFLANYGWTELVGQRGLIASNKLACGFLVLGSHTVYPKHSHEAEEIYVPLSAPSQWVQGEGDWVSRPTAVPIYHHSWLTHGMKTSDLPLLALYLWHNGDLTQKSLIN